VNVPCAVVTLIVSWAYFLAATTNPDAALLMLVPVVLAIIASEVMRRHVLRRAVAETRRHNRGRASH
jgi:hypothetical protein